MRKDLDTLIAETEHLLDGALKILDQPNILDFPMNPLRQAVAEFDSALGRLKVLRTTVGAAVTEKGT